MRFERYDTLLEREWIPSVQQYTGHALMCIVLYVMRHADFEAIPEGWALMSIEVLP